MRRDRLTRAVPRPKDAARLAATTETLFGRLEEFYDDFSKWHDLHNKTEFRCMRSGNCCKVGLEAHVMECENIARHLERRFAEDPASRPRVIASLKAAFTDKAWTPEGIIGDRHCSFYDNGCTIYPFRPAVCRMYGVVLEVDDHCPRLRLASGLPMLFVSKDVDELVRRFYRIVDDYGRLYPSRDYTVFMPRGVLSFLLSKDEFAELRRTTPKKFWKRQEGYRTQFKPSSRMPKEQAKASKLELKLLVR